MMGYEQCAGIKYDFIGILDGYVTFDSQYYEKVLRKFAKNSKLGIAGGIIFDQCDNHCIRRSPRNAHYVSGCIQLFRSKCYEDIGGFFPIQEGREDTIAVIMAQMKDWETETFKEYKIYHHKHSEAAIGFLSEIYREGIMFYALGSHPLFEIIKSIKRIIYKPYFLCFCKNDWLFMTIL
jgi:poly-beta-1,6-N-acetyl-D-glucosamine synthase